MWLLKNSKFLPASCWFTFGCGRRFVLVVVCFIRSGVLLQEGLHLLFVRLFVSIKFLRHFQNVVDCVWNVMAHAQKPDFVLRRNGRVHLNRQGRHFSLLPAAEVCASAVVMLDTLFRGGVKSTGYPLHSTVSPSLPLLCVTVCNHVSNGL